MGKRNHETLHSNRNPSKPRGKKSLIASGVEYVSDGFRGASRNGKKTLTSSAGEYDPVGVRLTSQSRSYDRGNAGRDRENQSPMNCFGDNCVKGTTYYRSNITAAVSDLKGVHISPAHYRLLEGTPFYAFIKL